MPIPPSTVPNHFFNVFIFVILSFVLLFCILILLTSVVWALPIPQTGARHSVGEIW